MSGLEGQTMEFGCEHALERIAAIDKMFDKARGWGSWMVSAANEREALVNDCRTRGVFVEHKNLARTGSGRRVD